MPTIADNTPLVAFAVLNRLELLSHLFGEILIPPAVREEFLEWGEPRGRLLLENPWIRTIEGFELRTFSVTLGLGEREALSLAMSRQGALVLLDDRKARRQAEKLGLPTVGTLGLLLRAKELGLLESIRHEVGKLQSAGLFLSSRLIESVLRRAGEGP